MKSILIIPDAHAHVDYDNDRFTWLGRLVVERKPDIIVCLGDWADMPSLSSYDKGKKGMEGKRYLADIRHAFDAQEKMFGPIYAYNKGRSRNARYNPYSVMVEGNHDSDRGRIGKALSLSPELDGIIKGSDLCYDSFWSTVVPFKDVINIEGISFTHYFPSGVMGKSIGGENMAASMLKRNMQSSVQGHTHILDKAVRTKADGSKCFALSAGCYTHLDFKDDWCANTVKMWWNGVIMLTGVENGWYTTYEEIPQTEIKKRYG